jgi:hypothetical protein
MKQICDKLQALYEKLKHLENHDEDLEISEPNQDDNEAFICFEQEIIHYNDGYFDISSLYNEHPTFKFESIEEVLAFFNGFDIVLNGGFKIDLQNEDKLIVAYNLGYYTLHLSQIENYQKKIIPQYLNKVQHHWA